MLKFLPAENGEEFLLHVLKNSQKLDIFMFFWYNIGCTKKQEKERQHERTKTALPHGGSI